MDFTFQPLDQNKSVDRANTIASRVFSVLRKAIVTMKLQPGNSLSEADVAKQLAVSRQPVREAFIQLSKIGMVSIFPQKGTYVVKISRKDVENARFIREAIELAIVQRACSTATPEDIGFMMELIEAQTKVAQSSDHERFLELDDAFHQMIAVSADCQYGWHIVENLKAQMDRVRFLSLPKATPIKKIVDQHRSIVQAIEKGDRKAACAAVSTHLGELLAILPKLAAKHADLFTDESVLPS